jgi:hypothetical protein
MKTSRFFFPAAAGLGVPKEKVITIDNKRSVFFSVVGVSNNYHSSNFLNKVCIYCVVLKAWVNFSSSSLLIQVYMYPVKLF